MYSKYINMYFGWITCIYFINLQQIVPFSRKVIKNKIFSIKFGPVEYLWKILDLMPEKLPTILGTTENWGKNKIKNQKSAESILYSSNDVEVNIRAIYQPNRKLLANASQIEGA